MRISQLGIIQFQDQSCRHGSSAGIVHQSSDTVVSTGKHLVGKPDKWDPRPETSLRRIVHFNNPYHAVCIGLPAVDRLLQLRGPWLAVKM